MKVSSGLAVAGLAASAQAIGYADTGCVKGIHLVSAGGEYTTQGNLSYLDSLAQSILATIPNSNHYQLPYQQNASPQIDLSTMIPALSTHITEYAAQCPNTKIVTIGYSIGAAIVMDVLCGGITDAQNPAPLSRDYRSNILANIVYGDPTFVQGMRSSLKNAGTCTGPGQTGHGVAIRTKPGACYPFGRKSRSFCDVHDPQCCQGNGDPALNPQVHFSYPGLYDQIATDFVKAKWNYYVRHRKGSQ